VVGAALSLAVIVALYVSRKTQIQKFEAEYGEAETPPAPPTGGQATGAALESEESAEVAHGASDASEQMSETDEEPEPAYGSSDESVDLETSEDDEMGNPSDYGDDSFGESDEPSGYQ
jgi:hypothetical protein